MSNEHINPVWKIRRTLQPTANNTSKSVSATCSCSLPATSRNNDSQSIARKLESLEREVERKNFELDMLREESLKKYQEWQMALRYKEHLLAQVRRLVGRNVVKSRQLLTLNNQFERLLSSNKENLPLNIEQYTICRRKLDEEQLSEIKNEPNIEDSDFRFMSEMNLMAREESVEGWNAVGTGSGSDQNLRL